MRYIHGTLAQLRLPEVGNNPSCCNVSCCLRRPKDWSRTKPGTDSHYRGKPVPNISANLDSGAHGLPDSPADSYRQPDTGADKGP